MAQFANIIVDISHEKLDKTFQYKIPEKLQEQIRVGMQVVIPFGNRRLTGYVVELTDKAEFEIDRMKEIASVAADSVAIEGKLIALASWIRENYGATMNQALKTVIPIKKKSNAVEHKTVRLKLGEI